MHRRLFRARCAAMISSLQSAIEHVEFQRPAEQPTHWVRVARRREGLFFGHVHNRYDCGMLHVVSGNSCSMVIPISGPIVGFLGRCKGCA